MEGQFMLGLTCSIRLHIYEHWNFNNPGNKKRQLQRTCMRKKFTGGISFHAAHGCRRAESTTG